MPPAIRSPEMETLSLENLKPPSLCIHCNSRIPSTRKDSFCCRGCETVYQLLQNRGLHTYYDLRKKGRSIRRAAPVADELDRPSFSYLDDPEFLRLYSSPCPDGTSMQFYLDGVHCAACVWLTEKVSDFVDGVQSVRLDLANSLATVKLESDGSFGVVAEEFAKLGYRPHPVKHDDLSLLKKRDERILLIQLAIAGACTGNIMLLAVSLYSGLSGHLAQQFKWISFALFLPIFFYSSIPFYRGAWGALRHKQVSIDIPIVLGILLGTIMSLANLITGSDHVYFDSLAALVFLLLASRYVLRRAQQNALNASNLLHFLTPSVARKKNEAGTFEEMSLNLLKSGDLIEVRAGDCIPVDGRVEQGVSLLNCALLTGESHLQKIEPGQNVYAGTINQQTPILIKVSESGSQTRLGKILRSMEENLSRRAPIVAFADRVSQIFVAAVLILVGMVFFGGIYFLKDWHQAMNHALALAIVTCPCAFALATPLAMSSSIARCARGGILVKGGDVLEKLSQLSTVFLDKTGTLTTGRFEVLSETLPSPEVQAAVYALEARSNHPIAKAIVRHLKTIENLPEVENFEETLGKGVSGTIQGSFYEVGRPKPTPHEVAGSHRRENSEVLTQVAVLREGALIGQITLGDRIRDDTSLALKELRSLGLQLKILSGDSTATVNFTAAQLDIPACDAFAEKTPEEKSEIVKQEPRALMVGDGANDAVALASAYVGLAVHSGMEVSMRAADCYLFSPGVLPIHRLIVISRETMKLIHRNFLFSLAYNLIGGLAAIFGKVDPLFAAVLMPLSAFTVLISSMLGTSQLRKFSTEEVNS